jgi:hypothetical protein
MLIATAVALAKWLYAIGVVLAGTLQCLRPLLGFVRDHGLDPKRAMRHCGSVSISS